MFANPQFTHNLNLKKFLGFLFFLTMWILKKVMVQDLAARVVLFRKSKKKRLSRQRMKDMGRKWSEAAMKGDKKAKRKLEAIMKSDRERKRAARYYKKTKAKAGVNNWNIININQNYF